MKSRNILCSIFPVSRCKIISLLSSRSGVGCFAIRSSGKLNLNFDSFILDILQFLLYMNLEKWLQRYETSRKRECSSHPQTFCTTPFLLLPTAVAQPYSPAFFHVIFKVVCGAPRHPPGTIFSLYLPFRR